MTENTSFSSVFANESNKYIYSVTYLLFHIERVFYKFLEIVIKQLATHI